MTIKVRSAGHIEDNGRPDEKDKKRPQRRNRWTSWQILAMSYMAVETLKSTTALAGSDRKTSDDDDDGQSALLTTAATRGNDGVVPDEFALSAEDDEGNANTKTGLDQTPTTTAEHDGIELELFGQDLTAGEQGYLPRALGSSSSANARSENGEEASTQPNNPVGSDLGPNDPFIPVIDFHGGFGDFAAQLGFGDDLAAALEGLDPAAQGLATIAFQFGVDPLSSSAYWQSIGEFQPGFSQNDAFSSGWTIQASGLTNDGFEQMQSTNMGEQVTFEQDGDIASKSLSNSVEFIDGQDWSGLLWVKGDYYEFNTIVQINIVWNDDDITIEKTGTVDPTVAESEEHVATDEPSGDALTAGSVIAGAPTAGEVIGEAPTAGDVIDGMPTAADYYPTTISTGENAQTNFAQIIQYANTGDTEEVDAQTNMLTADAMVNTATTGDPEPMDVPSQLVMGGKNDYYGVIQQNNFIELGDVMFEVRDTVAGAVKNAKIGQFADVQRGNNTQDNDSLIVNGATPANGAQMSAREFKAAKSDMAVEVVDDDYFEFNTVFQLNIIDDSESVDATVDVTNTPSATGQPGSGATASPPGSLKVTNNGEDMNGWGGMAQGNGVIASGGNLQYNTATIAKNDANDDLYVGGMYSQYNLVLQINVMQTVSDIHQISALVHQIQSDAAAIGSGQFDGSSVGGDGSDGTSNNVTLPNGLDELTVRGQTVDMTL